MEEEEHDKLSEVEEVIFYELPKLEGLVNAWLAYCCARRLMSAGDMDWIDGVFIAYRGRRGAKRFYRGIS
ncbi:hypothetical protein FACS1894147_06920 [Spirochaetia bacterium]|nr:hypothetical protein FACS1894147_06920 [Spirochaetia bacterium]